MKIKTSILNIILSILFISDSFSQTEIFYGNKIYSSDIQSVTLKPEKIIYGYPIISLNSDEKLELDFDDLNLNSKSLNYTLIYCNSDWGESNLSKSEYLSGFPEGEIRNYEPSFNTQTSYVHYNLIFPEESTQPLLSGNYIIIVYENYDISKPILTRRFYITDNKINISGEVKRSTQVSEMDFSQEISFDLTDNFNVISTITDGLKVSIMQNGNPDKIISNIQPDYISGNIYKFYNPKKIFFKAGNEYRYFNAKNYKYTSDRVAKINYADPYYIFELVHEKPEGFRAYSQAQDINGAFVNTSDDTENDALESEYVLVDFTMLSDNIITNGNIYLYGDFTDYKISDKYKLSYNYNTSAYELRLKLKQGFYNYMYVFAESENSRVNFAYFEGNHYETENDYQIFVYYRKPGTENDALIGYKLLNSLKKL
jgi:hypothetical protein